MLWTALVSGTVLCLAGFVGGDDDFVNSYPGKRKLAWAQDDTYSGPGADYLDDYTDDYPQLREANTIPKLDQEANPTQNPNPFLESYLIHTTLSLYTRNQKIQFIRASDWFQNFDYNRNLVVMVHGVSNEETYVENFFNTVAYALLQNGDYNVIGIDWRHFIVKENELIDVERNIEEAIKIGHVLNSVLQQALSSKYLVQLPRTAYIGHDLGCIPAVIQSTTYGFVFDSIYGLNPRPNLGGYDYLVLTQLHGRLVHTLSTGNYPYSLSHRDYHPIYTKDFYYQGNYANLAYQILANAIHQGNMTAQFCSSEEDYLRGYCLKIAPVPIWSRQMLFSCGQPVGKYFFELPSPKLRRYYDDQTYV